MASVVALVVALAALAGVLLAPISGVHPAMGAEILTAAFVVVVIGGLGSFWGVVLGGADRRRRARTDGLLPAAGRRRVDVPADAARAAVASARALRRTHSALRIAMRGVWRSPVHRCGRVIAGCVLPVRAAAPAA